MHPPTPQSMLCFHFSGLQTCRGGTVHATYVYVRELNPPVKFPAPTCTGCQEGAHGMHEGTIHGTHWQHHYQHQHDEPGYPRERLSNHKGGRYSSPSSMSRPNKLPPLRVRERETRPGPNRSQGPAGKHNRLHDRWRMRYKHKQGEEDRGRGDRMLARETHSSRLAPQSDLGGNMSTKS